MTGGWIPIFMGMTCEEAGMTEEEEGIIRAYAIRPTGEKGNIEIIFQKSIIKNAA